MKRNKLNRKFRRNLIVSLMTLNMISGMHPVAYGIENLRKKMGLDKPPELDFEKSRGRDGLSEVEVEKMEKLLKDFGEHKKNIKVKKLLKEREELNNDFIATLDKLSPDERKEKILKNLAIEKEIQDLKEITRDELKARYKANMLDNVYDKLPPKKDEADVGLPAGMPIPIPIPMPGGGKFETVKKDSSDKEYENEGRTDVKADDIEAARAKLNDANNNDPKDPFILDEDREALKTFGPGGAYGKELFELKKKQFEAEQKKNAKELERATKKYLELKQKQHAEVAEFDEDGMLEMDAQLEKALLPISIDNKAKFLKIIKSIGLDLDKSLMDILIKNEKKLKINEGVSEGGFEEDTVDISIPRSTTSSDKWSYEPYVVMPDVSGLFAEEKKGIDTYVRDYLKTNNYRRATIKFEETSVAIGDPIINPENNTAVPKPMITSATVTFHVPMLRLSNGKPLCATKKIKLPVLIGQYDPQVHGEKRKKPVLQIGKKRSNLENIDSLTRQLFSMQYNLLYNPTKIKLGQKITPIDDMEKTMLKKVVNLNKHFEDMTKKYGMAALNRRTKITDPFTNEKIIKEKETTKKSDTIQAKNDDIMKRMAVFEKTTEDRQKSYASEIWKIVKTVKEGLKKEFKVNEDTLAAGLDTEENDYGITLRSLFDVPLDKPFEFSKIRFGFFGEKKGEFYYGDPTPDDKAIYDALIAATVKDKNWQVKPDNVVKHKEGLELLKKELTEYKTDLRKGQMPKNLTKNQVMHSILENQIGILQPQMSAIENDKNYTSNEADNAARRAELEKQHDDLEAKIKFLRYLQKPEEHGMVPGAGAYMDPAKSTPILDTIIAKVDNELKIFEVNDPNKAKFDEIKQKVQERIESLDQNGTDNIEIAWSPKLDGILGSVNRVIADKRRKAKKNEEKTKYETIQSFVKSSRKDKKFDPAIPDYIIGNPQVDQFKELYQLILVEIDKITDIPKHELLEDKHKAEEFLKTTKEFGLDITDEMKNRLGIQDKDILEFKRIQDEKKKLEEENRKLQEQANVKNAYNKDLDMLKQLRQQKREILLQQKIKEAHDKGENPKALYDAYAAGHAGPDAKKTEREWYIEHFNLTDDEIDKILEGEGAHTEVKSVEDRLKEIEEQKKKDEEARKKKEEEERKKKEEEINRKIAEQQKKIEEEKKKREEAQKKLEENLKMLEELTKNPDKYKEDFYKDKAKEEEERKKAEEEKKRAEEEEAKKKAEEEEERKKAEEEEAKKKAEEEEAKKKAEEEEAKKKAEEEAKKEEAKKAEAKKAEAKEEVKKEAVEKAKEDGEEGKKEDGEKAKEDVEEGKKEEVDDDDLKTEEKSGSDKLPSEGEKLLDKQLLQSVMESSAKDQTIQDLRNQLAEAKKTDPTLLKLIEEQKADRKAMQDMFAKILKQQAENKPTTTARVASGVANTVLPPATMAASIPIAMKVMQPSTFNQAVATLAGQGVKFAPGIAEKATQALAENAIPQVVDGTEIVTGG